MLKSVFCKDHAIVNENVTENLFAGRNLYFPIPAIKNGCL